MRRLWVILFVVSLLFISTFLTVSGQTDDPKPTPTPTKMPTRPSGDNPTPSAETPTLKIMDVYIELAQIDITQQVPISVTLVVFDDGINNIRSLNNFDSKTYLCYKMLPLI